MPMSTLGKVPLSLEAGMHELNAAVGNIIDPNPPMVAESILPPTPLDRPGLNGDGVREMAFEERHQIAQSLAEAFEEDPNFSYMLRNENKRLQRLGNGILRFIEYDWSPNGVIYTNDRLSGAAIWTEPGKWKAGIFTVGQILKSLVGVTSPAEVARLGNALGFIESRHAEIERVKGGHYYLPMIGITPDWQSMGWGDALLKPMLERCDEEGVPAYLEASTPLSVPLYERNGFRVIAKGRYRGANEQLHFMWRESQG